MDTGFGGTPGEVSEGTRALIPRIQSLATGSHALYMGDILVTWYQLAIDKRFADVYMEGAQLVTIFVATDITQSSSTVKCIITQEVVLDNYQIRITHGARLMLQLSHQHLSHNSFSGYRIW